MGVNSNKTVMLFSGGLDSTTLLYELLDMGREVIALSVNYGQRHVIELQAAADILRNVNVKHVVFDIPQVKAAMKGSCQTDTLPVPEGHYAEASMKTTVSPNRNMVMLSLAGALAISENALTIAYGAHAGDHAIYPDCRVEFVKALREAFYLCHYHPGLLLEAPYIGMTKAEIVKRGHSLKVPYELTYSCYKGHPAHCGLCGTCVERREAFQLAGVNDPTRYEEVRQDD